ncbi:MAG: hypothetical protein ACKPBC_14215 [Sphaerospermopsis kisseleviana]
MHNLKQKLPWWLKVASKLILARLPLSYQIWKKYGLFEHGHMQSVQYAYQVFSKHFELVNPPPNFISLELGPGDSVLSAIISKSFVGSISYLVDSGNYASSDLKIYHQAEKLLADKKLLTPIIQNQASLEEICQSYCSHYLTSGLESLRSIKSQSVNFIWSQAVLEHIRKAEFLDTMLELRRIIRPDGVCSHVVDLKDHLGGSLNNLRFTENLWESNFMASSGFYTNRIRYSEMIDIFAQAGFSVEVVSLKQWQTLPTPKAKMSENFRNLSDEELCISGFSVLLRPN